MKVNFSFILLAIVIGACSSNRQDLEIRESGPNTLSGADQALGWELLFNGENMDQWRQYNKETVDGWKVENGEMIALGLDGLGADIITRDTFRNFELSLEWKISKGGNSGIFFNVREGDHLKYLYESGPEYQLLDDETYQDQVQEWQTTGANYAMHSPKANARLERGNYNHSRLIVDDGHVQHWLNDVLVVDYHLWTEDWHELIKESKWKDYSDYGRYHSGHIGLQDHGNQVHFRNVKIRRR